MGRRTRSRLHQAAATAPGPGRRSRLVPALVALSCAPGAYLVVRGLLRAPTYRGTDTCPVHCLTGLWCPLCGGTRATGALLRADLGTALGLNPFALLADLWLVTVLVRYAWWLRARRSGRPTRPTVLSRPEWVVVLALAAGFFVARNLPGAWVYLGPLLGPAG